ncbi:MAG TPA: cbb3-type cytochrome c oxidase subunit I [Candidatus Saccharimonadales bacterium]
MFGRLTFDALPHDLVTIVGVTGATVAVLGIIIFLFVTKGWGWFMQTGVYLWKNWLTSLDPKKIGIMYGIVAVLMLLRGVADAGMIRLQQAVATNETAGFLNSDTFQQIFSAHGTIMIFFVAMGAIFAMINLVVPLQIGARDVAFPFMNAVSFWLFAVGAFIVNISLVIGEFQGAGWLAYPPLSGLEYSPGVGVDYWIWALQIAGIGSLLAGINFLVTIFKMRAPGMTMMRLPMFVWSVLGALVLIVFAFPILTATLGMLSIDRLMNAHFFTSSFGGNPMMYVNLIWAWGHPEVYILVLPAFGAFSEIVATFSGKRLFGYVSMVWAIIAITFLSFIVWLHHFFTMGAGANVNAFFGIMTMVIAIPTGVKVFNWLFTMYKGRIRFTSPMIWFMGFIITFTIGGSAGVMLAVPGIDFQVHNSLFLVAHFHNMIIGGVLFGFFAAITYWFPKFAGFKLNETLGKAAAFTWIIGFLVAFMPLYILGFMGATRRLDHYDASLGWQWLFIVAGVGVAIIGLGIALQLLQIFVSFRQRKANLDTTGDPWNGRTLEWATISPPPVYNFARLPSVIARDQFWEMKQQAGISAPPKTYEAIVMPKNTSVPILIAICSFLIGFGLVWYIWWLAILGTVALILILAARAFNEDTEEVIPNNIVAKTEASHPSKDTPHDKS